MADYSISLKSKGLLIFKITRPEKRNAVSFQVIEGLEQLVDRAQTDPSVKAVMLTGSGQQSFCSGGDLDEFHALKTEEQALTMLSRMGNVLYRLATLSKPTLALLNGAAVGGGCEIASACDFRVAQKGAKLGFVQANLAITTGWGGASLLHERVRTPVALKILTDARLFTAEEMYEFGFVQEVVDQVTEETAFTYLENILRKDVGVLEAYKRVVIERFQATNLRERMTREIERCAILWEKDAHHEAVDRFLQHK